MDKLLYDKLAEALRQRVSDLEQRLKSATTSSVSSLKNMNGYTQRLPEISSYGKNVSVIEIDMNLLKEINDHYGHHSGDTLLRCLGIAMVEVTAAHMGLLAFDESGTSMAPKNAVRENQENDGQYVSRIRNQAREKDIYHIGGDEFRIIVKHKDSNLENIRAADQAFMSEVAKRFDTLWKKVRVGIKDDQGSPCLVDASFSYGFANTAEPMLEDKTVVQVQRVADNRAIYMKAWQKLTGLVKSPAGRSFDDLRNDPRLKGLEKLRTHEELFQFIEAKEKSYLGGERREKDRRGLERCGEQNAGV